MPRRSLAPRLLGVLLAAAGALLWLRVGWAALVQLDEITAHGEEGGRLVAWGLTGTVLMIAGIVVLHATAEGSEEPE